MTGETINGITPPRGDMFPSSIPPLASIYCCCEGLHARTTFPSPVEVYSGRHLGGSIHVPPVERGDGVCYKNLVEVGLGTWYGGDVCRMARGVVIYGGRRMWCSVLKRKGGIEGGGGGER